MINILIFLFAAAISLFSLAGLWWRVGDLFPIRIGEPQHYKREAGPGTDLLNFLKITNETRRIRCISFNFPKVEYSQEKDFASAIKKWIDQDINVEIIGGPKYEDKECLNRLASMGVDLKLTNKSRKEHIFVVDNPRQLWVEKDHSGEKAKHCYYTDHPFESVYEKVNSYLDFLARESVPWRVTSASSRTTVSTTT